MLQDLRAALEGTTPDVEGLYVELDSAAGKPLVFMANAYRTGQGISSFAPGQDSRFGLMHGQFAPRLAGQ